MSTDESPDHLSADQFVERIISRTRQKVRQEKAEKQAKKRARAEQKSGGDDIPTTFRWLDGNLRKLSKRQPTVCFTHFPLGNGAPMRPVNADALLERFRDFNLLAVFSGHHHGFTERSQGNTRLVTNRCCAISRPNHDKTKEKGYFLCEVREGKIERSFVEVSLAVA